MQMKLTIGTRGSRLALAQTLWVAQAIQAACPGVEVAVKEIITKGDRIRHLPLDQIGGKGLFTAEIEQELRSGEIDLAVHSMKDMPSEVSDELPFAVIPAREDPRDVLVLREGYSSLESLPQGARIGCGSKRRAVQLLDMRPDLQILPIRGNIDTRLSKIETEALDGTVLAAAGLHRLGLSERITQYFSPKEMIPACAQGVLAVQVKAGRQEVLECLMPLRDDTARRQVEAERAYLTKTGGGCHLPVGAWCEVVQERFTLYGLLGSEDGMHWVRGEMRGVAGEEKAAGEALAVQLREFLSEKIKQKG